MFLKFKFPPEILNSVLLLKMRYSDLICHLSSSLQEDSFVSVIMLNNTKEEKNQMPTKSMQCGRCFYIFFNFIRLKCTDE